CIIVSFEITGASSPSELTAIVLADRFRSGINDGSISLTDEKGNVLSIRKDSTRIEVNTPLGDNIGSAVPIVSIAQSGYVVIAGEIAVLRCTILSSEPVTSVKWYRINKEDGQESAIEVDNDKYFGGSTESPSLVINNTDRYDEGLYMCRGVNGKGEGESPPAFLRIYVDSHSNDETPGIEEGGQFVPCSDEVPKIEGRPISGSDHKSTNKNGTTDTFPQFLVMSSAKSGKTTACVSPLLLRNSIKGIAGDVKSGKLLGSGDLHIECFPQATKRITSLEPPVFPA
ncbi:uncharacterized protein, partial [Argopecten irradians]|uniref:uncharacterized protein n=1 Tax=Argopecten irradians TaxID=31199 RepID=UPI003714E57C